MTHDDPSGVDLATKFALIHEHWSPKTIARFNDVHLKLAKVQGEFVWHSHEDTDELFLVHRGTLTIELEDGDRVELSEGQVFVVPRGVRHRPVAEHECEIILLEPAGVINTGDAGDSALTADEEWI